MSIPTPDARSRMEISRMVSTFSNMVSQGAEVELRSGVIIQNSNQDVAGDWLVSSGGVLVNAIWNNNLIPYDGAACVLALCTSGTSTLYYVLAITDTVPALSGPAKVTAFTAGSTTCTVKINQTSYTAHRVASYTPVVNDSCLVLDMAGDLYVVGSLTVYTPPPKPVTVVPDAPAPAPPPPKKVTGSSLYTATDSGSWTTAVGGWNSYYGQNVYSGSGYVPPTTGAWFYSGHTKGVSTKTLTKIEFWLPPRRNAGAYNNIQAVHVYAHSHSVRDRYHEPPRVAGPWTFNVAAHWGGGWLTLPSGFLGSFGSALKAGGGISIAGDPYIGFTGVSGTGSSGALRIGWTS